MKLTTLLAENADEILAQTCRTIGATFDPSLSWADRREGAARGDFDGVWICGYLGVRMLARGELEGSIVAAPIFEGRKRPVYQSVIIARDSSGFASLADVAGATLGFNERISWSGYGALVEHLESHRRSIEVFTSQVQTGSHINSIAAVRDRVADVAAIDHTVWQWAGDRGETDGLVVIDRTSPWPAPPMIAPDPSLADRLIAADLSGVEGIERWVSADSEDYEVFADS